MNEEIKEITNQLKEIINKYPNRQLEILLYVFGRDNLMKIINEPTYDDLIKQNTELKEDIKNLVKIISKNCYELEATEEEFESLYRWENE